MGDPFVDDIIIESAIDQNSIVFVWHGRRDMRSLMKDCLKGLSGLLECFQHHFELLCGYIFII